MSEKKKAFVFDTNFIIQNKNLESVIETLSDEYSIYVTQVSIDERIGQQCRDLKKKYEEIAKLQSKYSGIANIKEILTYDKNAKDLKRRIQKAYTDTFKSNIIPFDKSEHTFSKILDRANYKEPPFIESTSDKGFKDALIWLSLSEYFKNNGEDEVLFVTDDNGFRDNIEFLCEEFNTLTGKTIEFKPNSYYKEIFSKTGEPHEPEDTEPLPDFAKIREDVEEVIDALRWDVSEDYYGNDHWYNTFTMQKEVDAKYMEVVFSGLKSTIKDHVFEKFISASKILDLDGRIADETSISMEKIESAYHLYEHILKNYPDYIEQFYTATAAIMNRSYKSPIVSLDVSDEDLPF